jgi:hypothetical protein
MWLHGLRKIPHPALGLVREDIGRRMTPQK